MQAAGSLRWPALLSINLCWEETTVKPKRPAGRGPLAGLRVLDLSRVLAGPFFSMTLGVLGAEILKIEELETGDQTRTIPPFVNGESHYFLAINRNKKSVAV